MMGENGVRDTFVRASRGADIAVIEGVMGMFDGLDGTPGSKYRPCCRSAQHPGPPRRGRERDVPERKCDCQRIYRLPGRRTD